MDESRWETSLDKVRMFELTESQSHVLLLNIFVIDCETGMKVKGVNLSVCSGAMRTVVPRHRAQETKLGPILHA